jgi:hypothetical protein
VLPQARTLEPFAPGRLWTAWRPLRFYGIAMGTRMTLCRLSDGTVWVHSPIDPDPELLAQIARIGPVAHIVAPSKLHHLWVRPFAERFPEARLYASPDLPARCKDLRFDGVLGDAPEAGWAADLDQCLVRGNLYLDEVVFLDPSSRTLIVADLCEEGSADWPLLSRLAARIAGIYQRHGPPRDMKLMFRHDRAATRRSVERILSWDFDRMILSHGTLLHTGAKDVFARAYEFALRW